MFKTWEFYIIIYLLSTTLFNQSYKITTKRILNDGAITILLGLISSLFCLIFTPFFEIKFPTNYKVYLFLFISIIFYTLNNRLGTTARKGIEASTYTILKQISVVFMLFLSFLFYKEKFLINKFIGGLLIVFSNILVFFNKHKFRLNKYLTFGILANISLAIALFIDVNYSKEFNLSFYIFLTFLIPSILIFLFEKIKVKDIISEYKNSNKLYIFLTSISWVVMMLSKLISYNLGPVFEVAILSSLTVIINVIVSYFLLKEKNNLIRKIISAILIIIGIILIKL